MRSLARVVRVSSGIFGLYILAFYVRNTVDGTPGAWNQVLPHLYRALMVVGQTIHHALAQRFETHRTRTIQLFALTIGSWLYRIDYGLWVALANGVGHAHDFPRPFDRIMVFFFYVPNLLLAEIIVRGERLRSEAAQMFGGATFGAAAALLQIGTQPLYPSAPGVRRLPP